MKAIIICALAGCAWLVLHSFGVFPYWIVVGQVLDELGNPVEQAQVTALLCPEDYEESVTTGEKGNFLVRVAAPTWRACKCVAPAISVSKPGYQENWSRCEQWSWGPKFTRVTVKLQKSSPDLRETAAFMKAAGKGQLDVVKLLLDRGADVNARDSRGYTPLLSASEMGHLDIVKQLLEGGADVNARDSHGYTPLLLASQMGYLDVVKHLLEKGADVNAKRHKGFTALMVASRVGYLDFVKLLLDKGADLNARDSNGLTALGWALKEKHDETAAFLKAYGAKE